MRAIPKIAKLEPRRVKELMLIELPKFAWLNTENCVPRNIESPATLMELPNCAWFLTEMVDAKLVWPKIESREPKFAC
jgi:hypothetical protein